MPKMAGLMNIDTVDGPLVPNVWSIRWTNSDAAVRLETKKKQLLYQTNALTRHKGLKQNWQLRVSIKRIDIWSSILFFRKPLSLRVIRFEQLFIALGNPMKLVTLRNFRISPCSLPLPFLTSYPLAIKHGLMEIPWKITYRWCSHLRWSFHKWRVPQNGWFTMETSYVNGFVEYPYGNPHVFRGFPGLMTTHFRGETFGPPGPLPRDRSATPPRRLWAPCHRSWLHIHRSALPWPGTAANVSRNLWRMVLFFYLKKNAGICWNVNSS